MIEWQPRFDAIVMLPRLRDLSIGHRVAITAGIVILIILLLALVGFLIGGWEEGMHDGRGFQMAAAEEGRPYSLGQEQPSRYEERLIQLEKEAIDEAFKKHIMRLYDIWVTDYQPNMPPRAVKGARNARAAYERSMEAIEERDRRNQERSR